MGAGTNTRARRTAEAGDSDGPALDGLVGAGGALIGMALLLAGLGYWTELALGTGIRSAAIAAAVVIGAAAGWLGRLRARHLPATCSYSRSTRR